MRDTTTRRCPRWLGVLTAAIAGLGVAGEVRASSMMEGLEFATFDHNYTDTHVFSTWFGGSVADVWSSSDTSASPVTFSAGGVSNFAGDFLGTPGSIGGSTSIAEVPMYLGGGEVAVASYPAYHYHPTDPLVTMANPDGFRTDEASTLFSWGGTGETIDFVADHWGSTLGLQAADSSGTVLVGTGGILPDVAFEYHTYSDTSFSFSDYNLGGWDGTIGDIADFMTYAHEGVVLGTLDVSLFTTLPSGTTGYVALDLFEHETGNHYLWDSGMGPSTSFTIRNTYDYTLYAEAHWFLPNDIDPDALLGFHGTFDRTADFFLEPAAVPEPGTLGLAATLGVVASAGAVRGRRARA